jgi:hypothetical protein
MNEDWPNRSLAFKEARKGMLNQSSFGRRVLQSKLINVTSRRVEKETAFSVERNNAIRRILETVDKITRD